MDFNYKKELEVFEAPEYPLKIEWYQDILYFILKRFKGGVTYSEFYEMWDNDLWALYRLENELIKEELKDTPKGNKTSVPEPEAPEEDDKMLELLREIRED